jgi:L-amino acid N-acyltransferase YncA
LKSASHVVFVEGTITPIRRRTLAVMRGIIRPCRPYSRAPAMIRDARESDLESIVRIYNAAIPSRLATADTEPISVESRRPWLREHDSRRHPLWVAERDGRVAGWLSVSAFYGRAAYAATAELSVYVDPARQGAGVASGLVQRALDHAAALSLRTYLGFIFAHNARSLALFRKFGFAAWAHLPRVAVLDGVERDLMILGKRVG